MAIAIALPTLAVVATKPDTVAPAAPAPLAAVMTEELARGVVDRVLPEVQRLRELEFKRPVPVEVVDDAQAREHFMQRLRQFGMIDDLETYGRAYALLGLLPADTDLLEEMLKAMEEQAGGYYDPTQGKYYLLDDAPAGAAAMFTAHELTHALEDQHYDLDEGLRKVLDDDDRMFALSALHEGSATLLMSVYMMQAVMRGELSADELQSMIESDAEAQQKLEELPELLQRQLLGPYLLGMFFISEGDIAAMTMAFPAEKVERASRAAPVSSEQILHPEKYWSEERRDDPRTVDLGDAGMALGEGWTMLSEGVVGELSLGLLVGADTPTGASAGLGMVNGREWTNQAAAGWGGDRWQLWERDDRSVVLLLTVWDSPRDAEEFDDALPGNLRRQRWGAWVAIVAGNVGEMTRSLLGALLAEVGRPED